MLGIVPAKESADEAEPTMWVGLHNIGRGTASMPWALYTLHRHEWGYPNLHTTARCQLLECKSGSADGIRNLGKARVAARGKHRPVILQPVFELQDDGA